MYVLNVNCFFCQKVHMSLNGNNTKPGMQRSIDIYIVLHVRIKIIL